MLFETLRKKLAIPLIPYSAESTGEIQVDSSCGITLNSSNFQGFLSRLCFLFFRNRAVRQKVKELEKRGVFVSTILSVYPGLDNPLIVFNQSASAERYCQDNILPKMDSSLKGIVKRILFFLGNIHPSVDSFILLSGDNDKFQQINALLAGFSLNTKKDLLCITTSNPVFLSFSTNTVPDYVVHHAELGDFELRQELHQVLGSLVSKPLAQKLNSEQHYLIESGLPGKPWFQLLKNSSLSMEDIQQRSLDTLTEFELKVSAVAKWTASVDIKATFTKQLEQSHKCRKFTPSILSACSKLIVSLPDEYLVKGTWQHGDYCINNLIFAEDRTYIIDFEEFGDTLMPLQDVFSLALSFYIQRDVQTFELLAEDLAYCLQNCDSKLRPLLPILFVYHLLFRLGSWGENPNRSVICEWLQDILIGHINSPGDLFPSILEE